jgi:proteasome lid subunit RPN8/RPN11
MGLVISTALLDAIRAQARAAGARECCGLLLGGAGSGTAGAEVTSILPAANVAELPEHRFEIDPTVLLGAHRSARAGGPAILGHYHSHPAGPATPSPVDAAMAEGRGEIWLIVGRDGSMGAWRAGAGGALHGRFEPVEMTVSPQHGLAPGGPWR